MRRVSFYCGMIAANLASKSLAIDLKQTSIQKFDAFEAPNVTAQTESSSKVQNEALAETETEAEAGRYNPMKGLIGNGMDLLFGKKEKVQNNQVPKCKKKKCNKKYENMHKAEKLAQHMFKAKMIKDKHYKR